jgi:hypothetical protein
MSSIYRARTLWLADRGYRNGSHWELDREIHIASDLVGDTGIEPVTSSV